MPVLRHVKGHSGTGGVIRHLTKDGRARAFASHLVEAGEGEWRGFAAADWNAIACEMDATRRETFSKKFFNGPYTRASVFPRVRHARAGVRDGTPHRL